jgi:hypothetical protein
MTTDAMTWVQFQPPVASFDFVRVHRRHCNGRRQRNEAFTMVCYVLLTLFHPQKKLDWIMFTGNSLKICQVDNVCISHWKMHPTKKKKEKQLAPAGQNDSGLHSCTDNVCLFGFQYKCFGLTSSSISRLQPNRLKKRPVFEKCSGVYFMNRHPCETTSKQTNFNHG